MATLTKKAVVEEAYRLGLGPSRAALDVHHKQTLMRMIDEHKRQAGNR